MPRTGRPPKPTALKLLEGVRDPRRVNLSEPKPSTAELEPPAYLDDVARAEWDRLAPDLSTRAGLSHWDSATFATYCSAVSKVAEAEKMLAAEGPLVEAPVFDRNGKPTGHRIVQNPAWQLWKTSSEIVLRCSAVLGLSPADRSRIRTIPPEQPRSSDRLLTGGQS